MSLEINFVEKSRRWRDGAAGSNSRLMAGFLPQPDRLEFIALQHCQNP
jgi:hypothetical protein